LEGTKFKLHPNSLFEGGIGPGLEPVGGEFQPLFETGYPGGGAYLIFVLKPLTPQPANGLTGKPAKLTFTSP
jgi:hypothetical protein